METKANTTLIGAFTLIVLALGFVFVYWLARGSEQGSSVPLTVIFEDPVTGLTVGSLVVFNGINIGTVRSLRLDPERPTVVVAGLSVQPLRSIKSDTTVTLGFQGLTGVGYVEMAGGSQAKPPIWQEMPEGPTLTADRSSMQDLLAGARTILARTDETLQAVERLVSNNVDDVTQSVHDVRQFTSALARNSDAVANLIDNVSAASAGIADATGRLEGIIDRSERLLAATDPQQIRVAIDNVVVLTENLAAQSRNLDQIIARADRISTDIESFSGHLPAMGERSDALLAAIDPEQFAATVDRLNGIVASIDPEQVRSTAAGLSSLGQTLEANRASIETILTDASTVSSNLATFTQRLPAIGERGDELLAAINPQQVSETLQRIDTIVASIEPAEVRATVEGFSRLADTLQAHQGDIDAIVTRVTAISANLAAFAENLPAMGDRTSQLLAALDPERLGTTMSNIDRFSATLAANSDEIDAIVADARGLSQRFDTVGNDVQELLDKLNGMVGEGAGGLTSDLQETLAAVRDAANAFNAQITVVGGGVGDFSERGLRDLQSLIAEGQQTISRLDGVISNLEDNPSGFIFGGQTLPEYGGQRR